MNPNGIIEKKVNGELIEMNYQHIAETFDKHFEPIE